MFKKLITASMLTLALGATFCTKPAFAVSVKDSSYCLNGPNQGTACHGQTESNCGGYRQTVDATGTVTETYARYVLINQVQYLYNCSESTPADEGKRCCAKDIGCFRFAVAYEDGDLSEAAICEIAARTAADTTSPFSLRMTGSTCFKDLNSDPACN